MTKRELVCDIMANCTLSPDLDIEVTFMRKISGAFDYARIDFGHSLIVCLTAAQWNDFGGKVREMPSIE